MTQIMWCTRWQANRNDSVNSFLRGHVRYFGSPALYLLVSFPSDQFVRLLLGRPTWFFSQTRCRISIYYIMCIKRKKRSPHSYLVNQMYSCITPSFYIRKSRTFFWFFFNVFWRQCDERPSNILICCWKVGLYLNLSSLCLLFKKISRLLFARRPQEIQNSLRRISGSRLSSSSMESCQGWRAHSCRPIYKSPSECTSTTTHQKSISMNSCITYVFKTRYSSRIFGYTNKMTQNNKNINSWWVKSCIYKKLYKYM